VQNGNTVRCVCLPFTRVLARFLIFSFLFVLQKFRFPMVMRSCFPVRKFLDQSWSTDLTVKIYNTFQLWSSSGEST
jgi:hypothetical protein